MEKNKIIRTVCYFTDNPIEETVAKVSAVARKLESNGYLIQTKRVCSTPEQTDALSTLDTKVVNYTSIGVLNYDQAIQAMPSFLQAENLAFNLDLSHEDIDERFTSLLFKIIESDASKTFNFTYTFNNAASSPYFPSAVYEKNGFAIGLQPTDLAADCNTLEEWLTAAKRCWDEIAEMFATDPYFLGIDSSVAPIGGGNGSFVHFVKRINTSFSHSVTTDIYTKITKFIKEKNPKPVGLCGMMLPCLEDDELAAEYEAGNFSIERNIFLSLHSGLGIDTYPIGIDERPERIIEILKLLQALSNKYQKPLSARFVSDGKTTIGNKTDFQNQYLADCTVRAL